MKLLFVIGARREKDGDKCTYTEVISNPDNVVTQIRLSRSTEILTSCLEMLIPSFSRLRIRGDASSPFSCSSCPVMSTHLLCRLPGVFLASSSISATEKLEEFDSDRPYGSILCGRIFGNVRSESSVWMGSAV